MTAWTNESEDAEYSTEAEELVDEQTVAPSFEELNKEIIAAAIEKAKINLSERNRFEYESWLARKFDTLFGRHQYLTFHIFCLQNTCRGWNRCSFT